MRHLIPALILLLPFAVAAPPASQKQPATAQAKKQPSGGLPAGAEKISDNTWRHTDEKGDAWIYIKTPFGYSAEREKDLKARERGKSSAPAAEPLFEVLSVADGVVNFERQTPFGKSRWSRKESDLNATEKASLEAYRALQKSAPAKQ